MHSIMGLAGPAIAAGVASASRRWPGVLCGVEGCEDICIPPVPQPLQVHSSPPRQDSFRNYRFANPGGRNEQKPEGNRAVTIQTLPDREEPRATELLTSEDTSPRAVFAAL
jgi:hypothetical protein